MEEFLDNIFPGKKFDIISDKVINFQNKNIIHSISDNPLENKEYIRYLFSKNIPIIWIKESLREQLFLQKELKDRFHRFNYKICVLTPNPLEEKMIFSNLNFPDLFSFFYFNKKLFSHFKDSNKIKIQESLMNLFSSLINSNKYFTF